MALMTGNEPVPVSARVRRPRLFRVGDEELFSLGKGVHAGSGGEGGGVLSAAVQHDDQRHGGAGVVGGGIEPVGAGAGGVGVGEDVKAACRSLCGRSAGPGGGAGPGWAPARGGAAAGGGEDAGERGVAPTGGSSACGGSGTGRVAAAVARVCWIRAVASARRPCRVRRVASVIASIWRASTAASLLVVLFAGLRDGTARKAAGPAVR